MKLINLQHQSAHTAEITTTLLVFTPILVMMIPLLLVYAAMRWLGMSLS